MATATAIAELLELKLTLSRMLYDAIYHSTDTEINALIDALRKLVEGVK